MMEASSVYRELIDHMIKNGAIKTSTDVSLFMRKWNVTDDPYIMDKRKAFELLEKVNTFIIHVLCK